MKMPKTVSTYCPKCKKHEDHSVSLYKKGRDRSVAEGNRRYARKQEGYGGQRKPKQRRTAKTTKKQTLLLKCSVCGDTIQRKGFRLRKMEITA
jgi:large subunit ribosomal protein L44e